MSEELVDGKLGNWTRLSALEGLGDSPQAFFPEEDGEGSVERLFSHNSSGCHGGLLQACTQSGIHAQQALRLM